MNNNPESTNTGLIIGIILGVLILGGLFLYMRGNGGADGQPNNATLDVNVDMPKTGGESGATQ